tara:strand:+ start:517 stop:1074 length:558 start_codon:yes stop_codon:yes gene_type:complete
MDANAGARMAARQRWMEKDAKYRSESLKFFNRETTAQRGLELAAKGFSRDISDDYQRALYVQGRARAQYEALYMKYLKGKGTVDEGGRARRRTTGLREMIRAKGALENAVSNEFGANMQRRFIARRRKYEAATARSREALGVRPEYGAPVLMPPTDRLSGALSIASQVVSIASGLGPNGMGLIEW